jgi:hypothetical protein
MNGSKPCSTIHSRKPEWYWDNDFDEHWDAQGLSDSVAVEYMTRLFLGPDRLERYSLEQVAQGIWFLIGESSPGQSAHTLLKSNVPLQQRIGCVDAMTNFFRVSLLQRHRVRRMSGKILSTSPVTCGGTSFQHTEMIRTLGKPICTSPVSTRWRPYS